MQTDLPHETVVMNASLEKLQEFLRGELSAVETYELATKDITHVGVHRTLQEIIASHADRIVQLRERIGQFGAEPTTSSGIWGAFAKVFQAGADLQGNRVAIAALEEGEDHGLRLYGENLNECDPRTRTFVKTELLVQQQHTHELCHMLKSYLDAPS